MKRRITLDVENLVGLFTVQCKDIDTGERWRLVRSAFGHYQMTEQELVDLLASATVYTFNGNHYDMPIVTLFLHGADLATLKEAGDLIITRNLKSWEFYNLYRVYPPKWLDHVDVYEVAPGVRISLKIYAGRIHAPTMQDLPVDPMLPIGPALVQPTIDYCDNDNDVTALLVEGLRERLELRDALSAQYEVDLRSKSDAQIAEAVVKARILKLWSQQTRTEMREVITGGDMYGPHIQTVEVVVPGPDRIEKRYIPHGYTFKYDPPAYIQFCTPHMRELLDVVRTADFVVTDKEEAILLYGEGEAETIRTGVNIPPELKGRDIDIAGSVYRMGIGGLHSQESCVSYYADDDYEIWDIDVASYYPSLILTMGMYPTQLGPEFLDIYRDIKVERLDSKEKAKLYKSNAKHYLDEPEKAEALSLAGHHSTIEKGLKIVLNGTFGKLWSKHSIFYAPEFGVRVTMTGQLALLMLIEMMEMSGVRVLSANTDGIVLRVPKWARDITKSNVTWWEKRTGLEMEYTHYRSIHFRDVNNYVAITTDGDVKRKGVFGQGGLLSGPSGKNPDKDICGDAVVEYLLKGTPIEVTILNCFDIRKFIMVRAVTGGGVYGDTYLGKAVRWYYSTTPGYIAYKKQGNKVAGSDYAYPVMTLPETFPTNVNHGHYINIAYEMLADIGIPVKYCYHPTGVFFITLANDMRDWYGDNQTVVITRKQYEKRKL